MNTVMNHVYCSPEIPGKKIRANSYIAADLGAGGGKLARGYFDGNILKVGEYIEFPNRPLDLNSHLYWDLSGLYKAVLKGMNHLSKEQHVIAAGIDTWGASYGLLDSQGRLLEPLYHYRDRRTEHSLEKIHEIMSPKELFKLTGCQVNRSYTLPQLYSYIEHGEGILNLADKMLLLPDLLSYFLCGEISTERSAAGTTGLMQPEQGDWAREVINRLGIPDRLFAGIVDGATIKGELLPKTACVTGNPHTKVVAVPGHDTAAAVLGIPGFDAGQVYISIGTNINMGTEVPHSNVSDRACTGGFKNAAVISGRHILYRDFSAFWLLNELQRSWKKKGSNYTYGDMLAMAEHLQLTAPLRNRVYVDVEDGVLNNAGGDTEEKINAFLQHRGQKMPDTKAGLVLCILESIALKVKETVEFLKDQIGIPVTAISCVNGGSRNYVLMQLISDALGKPVYAGMPYATLAGNLFSQLEALGEVKGTAQIRELSGRSFDMKEYLPCKGEKKRWDEDLQQMTKRDGN